MLHSGTNGGDRNEEGCDFTAGPGKSSFRLTY